MKTGDILEAHAHIPNRSRAIVFCIPEPDSHIIVTDFGNMSSLTESEVSSIYQVTNDWSSPDVWLQDKVNLIKTLFQMFPQLNDLIDL